MVESEGTPKVEDEIAPRERWPVALRQWIAALASPLVLIGAAVAAVYFTTIPQLAVQKDATALSERQLKILRENSEQQLRAYVGTFSATVANFEAGKSPRYTLSYKNFGQTPAKEVRMMINLKIIDKPGEPLVPVDKREYTAIMFPGQTHADIGIVQLVANEADIAAIKNGKILAIYGAIIYADIYDHQRETKFRYHYIWFGNEFQMVIPPVGNSAT